MQIASRQWGKRAVQERIIAEYLKRNPRTVIVRFVNGEAIVEKPAEGVPIKLIS